MVTLITEPNDYSQKALALYRSLGRVYFLPELGKKRDQVLKETEILTVRLAHRIDASWLKKMPNLKIIATPTTGLNHIDADEAKKRKVQIVSLKGHTGFLKNIPSTAEETFALVLALVRNLPWAFEDVKKGRWNRDAWRGHQLIHKTMGLLGVGRLGKIVAGYARSFGMRVIGADPNVEERTMKRFGVQKVAPHELFRASDIVSIHVPLEKHTVHLVREKQLRMMQPTAYLVNTARGEIVDERALLRALKNKWIAGAALDVMEHEVEGRHLVNNPLLKYAKTHSNLFIVPHIGGATFEAMAVTEEFIAGLVQQFVKTIERERWL